MTTLHRQEFLNILQVDWATYVQRFQRLSPGAQSVFLIKQGYVRFADLLSHIIAWFEVGYHTVEEYLTDPKSQPKEYDVDAFNAEAVAKAGGFDEEIVIESFEKMRNFMVEFVKALPDTAFEDEKVVNQLEMELIGHLSDHNIPDMD